MEQTICYSMQNYAANKLVKDKDLDYNFDSFW
jgi:hypothetical protein